MFKNILVAVDGSEPSRKALNYAVELAEKFDGRITLIHVYSVVVPIVPSVDSISGPILTPPATAVVTAEMADKAKKIGKQILDEAEQVFRRRMVSVETLLKEGDTVREIVSAAHDGKFDLIVVGHRGLSKLKELLLGSVSEGVSHKAPCAVMIVK